MNEHIEFLVKVKQRTLLVVVKIVLWILTVLGVLLTFTGILSIFPLIFAVITGLCANLCGLRADIEYEYTLYECCIVLECDCLTNFNSSNLYEILNKST